MNKPPLNPPFWGTKIIDDINIEEIAKYINKKSLFLVQWQILRGKKSVEEHDRLLKTEAESKLNDFIEKAKKEHLLMPKIVYGFFKCSAENNVLHIYKKSDDENPFLNFDFPRQRGGEKLCITDYFKNGIVAFHLVTIGHKASEYEKELFDKHEYKEYLYWHGFSVEMAEALAEYSHKKIREECGIIDSESLKIEDIFAAKYCGKRFSFGYPACPDLKDQKKIFKLLEPERIGVTITENYQLVPEQSTSAIITFDTLSKYFSI